MHNNNTYAEPSLIQKCLNFGLRIGLVSKVTICFFFKEITTQTGVKERIFHSWVEYEGNVRMVKRAMCTALRVGHHHLQFSTFNCIQFLMVVSLVG